jgi:hypothetical protein
MDDLALAETSNAMSISKKDFRIRVKCVDRALKGNQGWCNPVSVQWMEAADK